MDDFAERMKQARTARPLDLFMTRAPKPAARRSPQNPIPADAPDDLVDDARHPAPDGSGFLLTSDQKKALDDILAAVKAGTREMVLTGPAGSGKTTLMRLLISEIRKLGRRVRLVAPTGKAATRLTELTGEFATTIHSPLYQKVIEDADGGLVFSEPKAIASAATVVICDEASMLGRDLYADLKSRLPDGALLLCVGDREQLAPVNDTWGPNFETPTAVLTKVHRQALESPILALATHIRMGRPWRKFEAGDKPGYCRRQGVPPEAVAEWVVARRLAGDDAVLLTYTNKTRQFLNGLVRQALGRVDLLEPGDKIVCTRNNRELGIMNGEVREIKDMIFHEDQGAADVLFTDKSRAVLIPWLLLKPGGGSFSDFLQASSQVDEDYRDSIMRAEYGECLTIHRSQGSQFRRVAVVHDFDYVRRTDPDSYRRLMYTAVTRASEELTIFEV